jgi:hypothetical protein
MKAEFDDAGLPWSPAAERIGFLGRTLDELKATSRRRRGRATATADRR